MNIIHSYIICWWKQQLWKLLIIFRCVPLIKSCYLMNVYYLTFIALYWKSQRTLNRFIYVSWGLLLLLNHTRFVIAKTITFMWCHFRRTNELTQIHCYFVLRKYCSFVMFIKYVKSLAYLINTCMLVNKWLCQKTLNPKYIFSKNFIKYHRFLKNPDFFIYHLWHLRWFHETPLRNL